MQEREQTMAAMHVCEQIATLTKRKHAHKLYIGSSGFERLDTIISLCRETNNSTMSWCARARTPNIHTNETQRSQRWTFYPS